MTQRIVIADGAADTAQVAAFERDRRELLRRGFALGGAAVAASWIPALLGARNAFARATGDAAILERAIDLERLTALTYGAAIDGGLLSAPLLRTVRRLREHEQAHAAALVTALTDLGGIPPAPPKGVADVDEVVKGLRDVRSQADGVNFAIELETAVVAAYHDAHAKLVETRLLQIAASIMGSEGQHLVALRMAVDEDPAPNALETGES